MAITAKFKPLPYGLDLKVPFASAGNLTSPRWTLPGTITAVAQPVKITRGFQGRFFMLQFILKVDEMSNPESNICGTRTYQNRYTHIDRDESDDSPAFDETLVVDYVFNTTPENYSVNLVTTGRGPGVGYPSVRGGEAPDRAAFYKSSDEGSFTNIGRVALSGEVAFDYLDGKLALWMGGSREFRQATQFGYFWGVEGASRSESDHGYYSYVSGMQISAKANLQPDTKVDDKVTVYGYDAAFVGRVALVKRKNGPFVRDFNYGLTDPQGERWMLKDVYRSGQEGVELFNPIQTRKWRDGIGTYDRRSDDALADVGYQRNGPEHTGLLPYEPSYGTDRTARIGFLGRDGVTTYRVTMQVGHRPSASFVSLASYQLILPPTEMVDHTFATYIKDATEVVLTKLEARIGETAPFLEVPVEGAFGQSPAESTRVLVVTKVRLGTRWGHYRLDYLSSGGDLENQDYYRTKRTFRELKAETVEE